MVGGGTREELGKVKKMRLKIAVGGDSYHRQLVSNLLVRNEEEKEGMKGPRLGEESRRKNTTKS